MNKRIKKIFSFFAVLTMLIAIGVCISFVIKLRDTYKEKSSIVSKNINYVQEQVKTQPTKYEQIKKAEITEKINENKKSNDAVSEEKVEVIYPAAGKIINKYSEDEIMYLFETNDFRTHAGIDIETDDKNAVVIADGIIKDVYEDINNYYVVVVDHSEFDAIYKNIIISPEISIGKSLKKGDAIGKGVIGENGVKFIHYEIVKNGKKENPEKYFK